MTMFTKTKIELKNVTPLAFSIYEVENIKHFANFQVGILKIIKQY